MNEAGKVLAQHPLRFQPIFKSALWGGQSLRPMLGTKPYPEPTGEAWLLSDQGDNQSRIADGPLKGQTLRELMVAQERAILGDASSPNGRFPLLLKFLDARQPLSVQVHPNDEQARTMAPASSGLGKTEAWVILNVEKDSLIYAGLRQGVSRDDFHASLRNGSLPKVLHSYVPRVGDCVFLKAGTVHAIGAGLVLFEVQQTSDITYRLYDWDRVDAQTGKPRALHVEQAMRCTDFDSGPCNPVQETPTEQQWGVLVDCPYFRLSRMQLDSNSRISPQERCTIFVCIDGTARLVVDEREYPMHRGDVLLCPAVLRDYSLRTQTHATILACQPK